MVHFKTYFPSHFTFLFIDFFPSTEKEYIAKLKDQNSDKNKFWHKNSQKQHNPSKNLMQKKICV